MNNTTVGESQATPIQQPAPANKESWYDKNRRMRFERRVKMFEAVAARDLTRALNLAHAEALRLYDFGENHLGRVWQQKPELVDEAATALKGSRSTEADLFRGLVLESKGAELDALGFYRKAVKRADKAQDRVLYETAAAYMIEALEHESGVLLRDHYEAVGTALAKYPDSLVIQISFARFCRDQLFEYEDILGDWLDYMVKKHPQLHVVHEMRGDQHLWCRKWFKATKSYLQVLRLLASSDVPGSGYFADKENSGSDYDGREGKPRWSPEQIARLTGKEFRAHALFAAYDLERMTNNPLARFRLASVMSEMRIEGAGPFIDGTYEEFYPHVSILSADSPEENREKCRSIHHEFGLDPAAVYAKSPPTKSIFSAHHYTPGALFGQELEVKRLAPRYLVAISAEEPWTTEDLYWETDGKTDPEKAIRQLRRTYGKQHYEPDEYVVDLRGEIIDEERREVVGFMTARVYLFNSMVERFEPDYIRSYFDDDNEEEGALMDEILQIPALKQLLEGDGAIMLYLQRIRLDDASRGKGLGIKSLKELFEYARSNASCSCAVLKPYPLPQLHTEAGGFKYQSDSGTPERSRELEAGTRKLVAYYEQVGMKKPHRDSNYLYLALEKPCSGADLDEEVNDVD